MTGLEVPPRDCGGCGHLHWHGLACPQCLCQEWSGSANLCDAQLERAHQELIAFGGAPTKVSPDTADAILHTVESYESVLRWDDVTSVPQLVGAATVDKVIKVALFQVVPPGKVPGDTALAIAQELARVAVTDSRWAPQIAAGIGGGLAPVAWAATMEGELEIRDPPERDQIRTVMAIDLDGRVYHADRLRRSGKRAVGCRLPGHTQVSFGMRPHAEMLVDGWDDRARLVEALRVLLEFTPGASS